MVVDSNLSCDVCLYPQPHTLASSSRQPHSKMKVYVNRVPRSLALVERDWVLIIRYAQNASLRRPSQGINDSNDDPDSSHYNGSANGSPKCIIEFVKRDSINFDSRYRLLCPYECQGCLGLIEIGSEVYLSVITKDSMVARPRPGETVNRIHSVEFYCLNSDDWDFVNLDQNGYVIDQNIALASSAAVDGLPRVHVGAEHPCASVRKLLSNGSFYYSSNFDVATVLQYRGGGAMTRPTLTLEMADRSFMWNSFMTEGLINFRSRLSETQQADLDECHFLATVIRGFAESKDVKLSGIERPATLTIISRQSWRRAGTRFNARGVDDDGNVANFVETETILSSGEAVFGFTQIRGSVPTFWEQDANLLSAKINITRSVEAAQPAFNKHFEQLIAKFGIVHIVNLLANKAGEIDLTYRYRDHVKAAKDLRGNLGLTEFDFHAEVAKGGYAQAGRILPYLDPAFESINFYCNDPDRPDTKMEQVGIFRTNCLDCLDRTNMVQQLISKYALELFCMVYKLSPGQDLWNKHNFLWADNGDQLSQIYAGTNALKTSFTRSGKMNIAGALADVTKSVGRMYINNFVDKSRQNTMDVLLGRTAGQHKVLLFDPINDYVTLEVKKRAAEYSSTRNIKVFAGTFNLNGVVQPRDLSEWLFPANGGDDLPDIVLVGFQEIVELTPSQILNAEPAKREFWEKQVSATLSTRDDYVLVRSDQLVGTALMMFVRTSEVSYISKVEGSMIKTGLGGMAGNKGGIAVSFYFANTSFCFITAHLAAGTNNVDERHHNFKTISTGLVFSRGRRVKSHDSIIWLGDFNYRIDLPYDLVKERIKQGDLEYLFEHDQLNRQMVMGETFPFYNEMQIKFPPTYKFDNGSNVYDTSEKMRTPSWTDRILSRGSNLRQTSYGCVQDIMFSDHRPVYATFNASVTIVDQDIKKRMSKELYERRLAEVGDANDLVSLINLNETTLTHGLPPPSTDGKKWWINGGQPAKVPFPAPAGHKINPDRNPNPFVPDTDFVKPPLPPRPSTFSVATTPQPVTEASGEIAGSTKKPVPRSQSVAGPSTNSTAGPQQRKAFSPPPIPRKPVSLVSKPVPTKPSSLSVTSASNSSKSSSPLPKSAQTPTSNNATTRTTFSTTASSSTPIVSEPPPLPPRRKGSVPITSITPPTSAPTSSNPPSRSSISSASSKLSKQNSAYLSTRPNSSSSSLNLTVPGRSLLDDDADDVASTRAWTPPPNLSNLSSNSVTRSSTPKSLLDDDDSHDISQDSRSSEATASDDVQKSQQDVSSGLSVLQPMKPTK